MLSVKNLRYDVVEEEGQVGIIHDISMEVPEGKFIVITGPNGGGKSSLAKCIAGVYQPTGGIIEFDGQDITHMSITDRAKLGISFAFQQPVRFKGVEVFDLLKLASGDKTLSVGAACSYLSEVGLCAKDYINREVDASLSGGELKRIEIATVLARKSRLSIFDEPEAGIDLWSFSNLIKAFEKIKKETNGSIVIISHQERILEIADTIVVIERGRVKAVGDRQEILPTLLGTESAYPSCRVADQEDDVPEQKADELSAADAFEAFLKKEQGGAF